MKKTYNISLGGRVFNLEEDAGDRLQAYIERLEAHYSREEGGNEIMSDIENRIAELFQEYMKEPNKEVITLTDIDRIIQTMGSPDDIIDDENESTDTQSKIGKELYRNIDHRILGGVAAGLATYLGIPVLAVRCIFIMFGFFYGLTIWIYLILWIIVPAARNSKQKMEMKGERINISNIERHIRTEFDSVKNGNLANTLNKTNTWLSEFFGNLGGALSSIAQILLKILSAIVILAGIASLLGLAWTFTYANLMPWGEGLRALSCIMPGYIVLLVEISILLFLTMPVLLVMWLAFKYLFHFKNSAIPLALIGLWITGILLGCFVGISQGINFSAKYENISTATINTPVDSCLIIKMNDTYKNHSKTNWDDVYMIEEETGNTMIKAPEIYFERSSGSQPELVIKKRAYGTSRTEASDNTEMINFNWVQDGQTLTLDKFFSIDNRRKWRADKVRLILRLPENYRVFLDRSLKNSINSYYWNDYQGNSKTYKMGTEGLELIEL